MFEPKSNPPEAVQAMTMFNELELSKVPIRNPHPQNLSKNQRKGLKDLKENLDIVIKPADKGSARVIQRVQDYIEQGKRQLSDAKFYKPLESSPTEKHNKIITERVTDTLNNNEIHSETFNYLTKNLEPRNCTYCRKYIKIERNHQVVQSSQLMIVRQQKYPN